MRPACYNVRPGARTRGTARLPQGATKYSCRTEAPTFQEDLEAAIDTVKREHPEAFNDDEVKNVGLYVLELIKAFDR
jgi:hypothetical protein